jgi:hypothetical protein
LTPAGASGFRWVMGRKNPVAMLGLQERLLKPL